MSKSYSESVGRLREELNRLPGVGTRTAERLAYHIVRLSDEEALKLARAIEEVKKKVRRCSVCGLISERDPCPVCSDPRRDHSTICVVEDPRDATAIEESGGYQGLYHVLGGRLAPLEGIEPEDLNVEKLRERIRESPVGEVILATNPDMEGDATALFVRDALAEFSVKITTLARGIPSGSHLEYADGAVVADALEGRRELSQEDQS